MAQTTLQGPDNHHDGPNTREQTSESGWSFKRIVDAVNVMFGELYGSVAAAQPIVNTAGVGAKNGATVTAAETGNAAVHKTVLTLAATPITLTDDAGAGQYGGVKLYDFPAGNIMVLGAVIDADLTLVGDEWADEAVGDVGLGTTAVTDGDALATTEQNIIATTAIAAMTAQAGPINAQSEAALVSEAAGGTDLDLILNVRIDDDAAHITASGTITGTVTVVWANLGDF